MEYTPFNRYLDGLFVEHHTKYSPTKDLLYMHTHNEYELLYIISGDVTHVIEDRKYKLKKDDLVIIRPNDYHFIQIDSSADYERYDLLFNPEKLGITNIDFLPKNLDIINCADKPILKEMFKKIDYYQFFITNDELRDVISLILKELFYNLKFSAVEKNNPQNIHPVISKALENINTSLFTIKSITEIAEKLYVTESYLYRIFKRELKTTPLKYITEKRLIAAQNLIIQGEMPTHIYSECGFDDYTSFYRSYIKFFGYPPSKEKKEDKL